MKNQTILLAVIVTMLPCLITTTKALERKPVDISGQFMLKTTRQAIEKAKLGSFIADAKSWTRTWAELQPGKDAPKDAPKVDFKKSLLLVHVRDTADPNRHRFNAFLNEGNAELMALSTRIGFQRSEKATITFHTVSREGIKAVKSWDVKQRKFRVESITGAADKNSAKVTVTVILPEKVASFEGRRLDVRLYEFDPLLADVGATLVDQIERKSVAHQAGEETKLTLELGAGRQIKPRRHYYVTLFYLDGKQRTHMGEKDGKRGLAKVLTDNNPRSLTMIVRPVN